MNNIQLAYKFYFSKPSLHFSRFDNPKNKAKSIQLRNPLFAVGSPCFVAGVGNKSSNLMQKPCEQERPFTCELATKTINEVSTNSHSDCFLEDICLTPVDNTVAQVGCPYILDYKTQAVYENSRIINGNVVPLIEHPWMVKLMVMYPTRIESNCGASIISPTYIVTARHCFGDSEISYGEIQYSSPSRTETIRFQPNDVTISQDCDVALIRLPQSIVFSPYAMPIMERFFSLTVSSKLGSED